MALLPLAGKHCAVVGATGIIGFSIAKAFAQQGAVLSLLARSAVDARPRLEPQLRPYSLPGTSDANDLGVPAAHRFIKLDVADRESIKAVFGARGSSKPQTATTVGPIDILVNCAGITQTSLLIRTSDEHLSNIVDTNLLATMLVCKHAKMRPNGIAPREIGPLLLRFSPSHGNKRRPRGHCLRCIQSRRHW
ncbi:NAD(P)-binding protein [Trichoderma citrinoviride]|uniref:NAD(P)-binding protein n=1 Tax=Trichoderma citrinoviride TaxID=58853 RepID=A0A2T4BAS8_9HYPO|nr:NAD(P)-binding protein [Trichoderma citrinoviride]PTB66434.1 NAD(P)-binding protein [Trichoderma citrinoviride]